MTPLGLLLVGFPCTALVFFAAGPTVIAACVGVPVVFASIAVFACSEDSGSR